VSFLTFYKFNMMKGEDLLVLCSPGISNFSFHFILMAEKLFPTQLRSKECTVQYACCVEGTQPKQIKSPQYTALQGKFHLCITFLGIARPQPQISTFMCLRAIYIVPGSVYLHISSSRIGRPIVGIYKSRTDA
jgi:hypothetical protein